MGKDSLSWEEHRFLILLGLPALGLALAYTLVTTYLPFFIERLSGAAVTGIMIGGEGIFALFIPFVIGAWSDSIKTKFGRRLPFIFAATLVLILTLILMPLSSQFLTFLAIELAIFYIAYFTYYAAYYALFPDLVPKNERGRSQGMQGGFRSLGMLLALAGGGVLLHFWKHLPFLIVCISLVIVTVVLYYGIRHRVKQPREEDMYIKWRAEWDLIQGNPKIRLWFIANTCWEAAVGCLKAFVVLYFTRGLGFSLSQTSVALSLVGIAAIFAAPIAGVLADKYSHRPVILIAVLFFAIGLIPPIFTTNPYYISLIIPVAFAAVVLITLPYSLLMEFLPEDRCHGAGAALFGFSQGIGVLIGPLVAGFAVEIFKNVGFVFGETHGYAAIYPVASIFLLLSIPFSFYLFQDKNE